MRLLEHYVCLRNSRPEVREGEGVAVSSEELAGILDCTKQNVRLVLKQMVAAGWIRWVAGLGRGNVSELTFLRSTEQVVFEWVVERSAQGDWAGAFAQLGSLSLQGKTQFWERLSEQFGFQEEPGEEHPRDVLRSLTFAPYANLDPATLYLAREFNLATQIFDGLVRVNPVSGAVEPHLVHSWDVDASGRVWTFYLRKGVLFHHGREMTAEDVVWTLQRLGDVEGKSPFRWMVEGIQEMRVLKSTTVEVTLREPNFLFLPFLAAPPAAIVPVEAGSTFRERFRQLPVGTGPFQVVRNDEQQLVLEAHKSYFQGRPFLDRVEYWVVPREEVTARDVANMGVHLAQAEQERPGDWQEKVLAKKFVQSVTLNLAKEGPLQDRRVRQALHAALDPERMVTELGGIRARLDGSLWGRSATRQVDFSEPTERVQEMQMPLRLYTFLREENAQDARWIQARCAEVGIPVEVTGLRVGEFQQRFQEADLLLKADMVDEHVEFSFFKLFGSENSLVKSCLPAELGSHLQQELACLLQEPVAEKRAARMQQVDDWLLAETAVIYLYREQYVAMHPSYVRGILPFSTGLIDLRNVWFTKSDG